MSIFRFLNLGQAPAPGGLFRTTALTAPQGVNLTESNVSEANGQRFIVDAGEEVSTTGEPAFVLANNNVLLRNSGDIDTLGASAVVAEGDDARIRNQAEGDITSDQSALDIIGEDASIINAGTIAGGVNGVNFVNNGDSGGNLVNRGTISSDSRAVNIGGENTRVANTGEIIGTGDQRNGTIYTNGTADDFRIINQSNGLIDAGEGNNGAGIALQIGDEIGEEIDGVIRNRGEIVGRGDAAANLGTAGDGIRVFAGAEDTTFDGRIFNTGTITAEAGAGPVSGLRFSNGVNFDGDIINGRAGEISGASNGLYFGTGTHDAFVNNRGTISSDSRAVNIDGSGVDIRNAGTIIGTDDQRNGTIYADGTADDYSIRNTRSGVVDAGEGNNGSAISLQTGDVDGDTVEGSLFNRGQITGRGDATEGNTVGDGVRVFSAFDDVTFEGDIDNRGTIAASEDSAAAVGIRIEDGVTFDGTITNRGTISATETAIDASDAGGSVTIENRGTLEGQVLLSDGDDTFNGARSRGDVDVTGGLGNDNIVGGRGSDTVRYDDQDVPVTVDLAAGTATRETGFTVTVEEAPLASLTTGQSPIQLVKQALADNLYYNIHTNDFNGGEIRGQLITQSNEIVDGVRVITLQASLDAAQEPGPLSDSAATGTGTVVIRVDGGSVTYSSELSVTGLAVSDLLPVAGVSSIHLHNAPAGSNGPVITDIVQDAGGDVNGLALLPEDDSGDGNVFVETLETDSLSSIENVVGSNDGDSITGNAASNRLEGQDGDDILVGGGGNDIIDGGRDDDQLEGGAGSDTFLFAEDSGVDTVADFEADLDVLDFTASGADALNAVQDGDDVLIDLGEGNTVTLIDTLVADLNDENALF